MKTATSQIRLKFTTLPLYLIFIGVLFSASVFFIWLDSARSYQSEISIFFAPKSDVGAWQSEQIIGNLEKLPVKLSFYEQMIEDDESIGDFLIGKNREDKIEIWNEKIEARRELESSIVTISYADPDRETVEKINRQSVYTLFGIMSRFYDIKDDIDLRIIEGPIVRKEFPGWPWAIIGSLGGGIVFIALVQLISALLWMLQEKILGGRKLRSVAEKNSVAASRPTAEAMEKAEIDAEYGLPFHFPEVRMAVKKAAAPDNLPVAEEIEEPIVQVEAVADIHEVPRLYEESELEPTDEERKAMLNRLLRGEM